MSDAPQHWRKAIVSGVACLVPTDEASETWLKRRKIGEAVAMQPDHVRNAARSALYWTVCAIVAETHPQLKSREEVSDTLKLLAGLVQVWTVELASGEKCFLRKPKSISFASMSEDEFEAYMQSAFDLIERDLLPGCDLDELRRDSLLRSGNVSAGQVGR